MFKKLIWNTDIDIETIITIHFDVNLGVFKLDIVFKL